MKYFLNKKVLKYISSGFTPDQKRKSIDAGFFYFGKNLQFENASISRNIIHIRKSVQGGICVILPTYLSRTDLENHTKIIENFIKQLHDAKQEHKQIPIIACVGMQYSSAESEDKAMHRLNIMINAILLKSESIFDSLIILAVTLKRSHKLNTLNSVIKFTKGMKLIGIGWLDDDVVFSDKCWSKMIARFIEKGSIGAIGAIKIPIMKNNKPSKIVYNFKKNFRSATNYPHGCGIIVSPMIVVDGIPSRYTSDDGYIFFKCIDTSKSNPLENLELIENAYCFYTTGGGEDKIINSLLRIRRNFLNIIVLYADFPPHSVMFHFKECLLVNLYPFSKKRLSKKSYSNKKFQVYGYIYLILFILIGFELFVRGLLKYPITEIRWHGTDRIAYINQNVA